ncbi:MAG: MFS transporter [Desulforhopalus sp.]|jgi:sugar phosphate permease|nr:MFS transporter [Desulforhopalus sp.]
MSEPAAVLPTNRALNFAIAKWSIFAILILTYILVYFHRMAPGVVSEYLMSAFHTTGTRLGTLSAIYFFVYACMQIPSGVLADTLGTRVSVVAGNTIAGVGSIVFGMANSFETACIGRFFVGLGVSVVFVSIMKSNSLWFHERVFGLLSGLTLLIGNLGSVLAAGPFASLLLISSWRTVFVGIGIFSLILAAASLLLVRDRPEDLGFTAPNARQCNSAPLLGGNWLHNLRTVIRVRRLWPGFWVQFGMVGGLYTWMGLWGIPYLRDVHGLDRSFAADHITAMLVAFAFGALFFGWFSDRLGQRRIILIASVLIYLLSWLWLLYAPWSPGPGGLLLFAAMGFAGSGFVLTFAAAKELIHPNLAGMAVAVVNTGCFAGTALLQPLFGYLVDLTWNGTIQNGARVYAAGDYQNGFWVVLAFAFLALAAAFLLQETWCRNITVANPDSGPDRRE